LKKRNTLRRNVSKRNRSVRKMARRVRNRMSKRMQKGGGTKPSDIWTREKKDPNTPGGSMEEDVRELPKPLYLYNIKPKVEGSRNDAGDLTTTKSPWGNSYIYEMYIYDGKLSQYHYLWFSYTGLDNLSKTINRRTWPQSEDISKIYYAKTTYQRAGVIVQTLDDYLTSAAETTIDGLFRGNNGKEWAKREIYHLNLGSDAPQPSTVDTLAITDDSTLSDSARGAPPRTSSGPPPGPPPKIPQPPPGPPPPRSILDHAESQKSTDWLITASPMTSEEEFDQKVEEFKEIISLIEQIQTVMKTEAGVPDLSKVDDTEGESIRADGESLFTYYKLESRMEDILLYFKTNNTLMIMEGEGQFRTGKGLPNDTLFRIHSFEFDDFAMNVTLIRRSGGRIEKVIADFNQIRVSPFAKIEKRFRELSEQLTRVTEQLTRELLAKKLVLPPVVPPED